jgi:hypothetical protein
MKKFVMLFVFIAGATAAGAQDLAADAARGKVRLPNPAKQEILILNLTFDNWADADASLEVKGFRSRGFSFLLMNEVRLDKRNHVALGFGVGLSSQNVHSRAAVEYNADQSYTSLVPIPDSVDYDLNKLALTFIDQSVEFRFRTVENANGNNFHVALGFKIGELIASHTKYKKDDDKIKVYNIRNLTSFQYGPTARIGFGHWSVSGYYSLAPLFKEGKGPEMHPYSLALTFSF